MKRFNQHGALHLAAILVVAVIAVVGFAGYKVVRTNNQNLPVKSTASSQTTPAMLHSTADVKQASASLDNTQIDSGVNPDQLDQDLNDLL